MPYLNQDDNFATHPKNAVLSDAAYRFHHASLLYIAKYLLDGYLTPAEAALQPRYSPARLREVIATGQWHDLGDGCGKETCPLGREGRYLLHDYLQWNKSRTWWEAKRIKDAERVAKWRTGQTPNKEAMKRHD